MIIPSRSRDSIMYPKNIKLGTSGFRLKIGNERFSVACSRCRQNLKFLDFRLSSCRELQKCELKSVPHVQHDYYHLHPLLKRGEFFVKFYFSSVNGLSGRVSLLTNETLAVML